MKHCHSLHRPPQRILKYANLSKFYHLQYDIRLGLIAKIHNLILIAWLWDVAIGWVSDVRKDERQSVGKCLDAQG